MPKITSTKEYEQYTLTCYDPFGHWKITNTGGGATPDSISGMYTSSAMAIDAIDAYKRRKEQEARLAAAKKKEEAMKPENFKFKKPKETEATTEA